MCDSVYKAILMPVNQCSQMGIEYVLKSERIGYYRVTLTKDTFGQYRVTLKHIEKDIVVSAILFDQFKTVAFKYTLPEYRNNGFTKQLFAYACITAKKSFRHSEHLTEAGAASI